MISTGKDAILAMENDVGTTVCASHLLPILARFLMGSGVIASSSILVAFPSLALVRARVLTLSLDRMS